MSIRRIRHELDQNTYRPEDVKNDRNAGVLLSLSGVTETLALQQPQPIFTMPFYRNQLQLAIAYGAEILRGDFHGPVSYEGTAAAKFQSPIACTEESLRNILPDGSKLLLSQKLEENSTFHVPESEIAYTQSPAGLTALCALQVEMTGDNNSRYSFGLFLPEKWNGKFL